MSWISGGSISGRQRRPAPLSIRRVEFSATRESGRYRCFCRTTALPSLAGDVVLVEVTGELDAASVPEVAAALDRALDRPAVHVVVCLAGVMFCAARGLEMVVDAGLKAADRGVGYSVGGASGQMRRFWSLLWVPDQQPTQFADSGRAVLAALKSPTGPPRSATAASRPLSAGHR